MSSPECLTLKLHCGMYRVPMNIFTQASSPRSAAATGLAVVGFVALVGLGMWLAVYSTRYVPTVVNGAGAAAVYLGSVFNRSTATLSVVPTPTASSTISSTNTATSTVATSTVATPAPVKPVVSAPTPGEKKTSTYPINGTAAVSTPLSGLPDFIVVIKGVGYLATSSADSFIASSTVPTGSRPAVSFTIKNVGGNASGAWRFSASIPTQTAYIFQSPPQQALNPGDSIDYTLGFDQANRGLQTISITANFDHAVTETNPDNNSASAQLTILGS